VIRTAYLRIYLPAERVGPWPSHTPSARARVVRASDHFVWDEPLGDDAFTVEWRGRRYLCPRFPRLRMLEGLLAFSNAFPGLPLVPEGLVDAYAAELAELKSSSPDARSYILSSPWHVPVRWFAAFHPDDREVYESGHGPSIRYRTAVGDAVDRVLWASAVLRRAGFADPVVEQVRGLERWLAEFSVDAMVELDYAGVAAWFDADELAFDESAAEVRKSLEALERGDYEEAGEFYTTVAARWAPAQAVAFSN